MEYEALTFEAFGTLLDEVSQALPEEIFIKLNGGINLLPEAPPHPESKDLLILGQYNSGGNMGRYINIYYGSFIQLYGHCSRGYIKNQLDKVLRHEFLHHLESLAGERELEIKDALELAAHKRRGWRT